jgi:hypothetical protein
MAGLYDRTLLALCQESTGDARGLFQAPDTRGSRLGRPSAASCRSSEPDPVSGMLGQTHHRRQSTGGPNCACGSSGGRRVGLGA